MWWFKIKYRYARWSAKTILQFLLVSVAQHLLMFISKNFDNKLIGVDEIELWFGVAENFHFDIMRTP